MERASHLRTEPDRLAFVDRWSAFPESRHILVIEDEYLIASEVAYAIKAFGHHHSVEMVGSIPAALSALYRRRPDGVILDVHLQGKNDFSLADMLTRRRIPFVFMTGHDDHAIPPTFCNVIHCQKPVAPWIVVRTLLDVIRCGSNALFRDEQGEPAGACGGSRCV